MTMNQNWRKPLRSLFLIMLLISLWAGFSNGSGTDVTVRLQVIGNGLTEPPAGDNLFYQGDSIAFTATPADGWSFNRWINGEGDDLDDPGSAVTSLKIESFEDITLTVVFTSDVDSAPISEIVLPFGDVTIAAGESFNFQGDASDGNPPYTYVWDFNGGAANSTEEDPGSQVFNTSGVYQVTLTAFDDDGDPDTDTVTVTVTGDDDDGGGGGGGGCFLNNIGLWAQNSPSAGPAVH